MSPDQRSGAPLAAIAPSPCVMVLLGATGDLTKRLLLPSLYNLAEAKALHTGFRLLGAGKDALNDQSFQQHIDDSVRQFWGADADRTVIDWLKQRASYLPLDFGDNAGFDALKAGIGKLGGDSAVQPNLLFYLAIAPSFIAAVAGQLARAGLLVENGGAWRRLVIEKPFGHDLASALQLNDDLHKSLQEDQIYRIDHFAGKDAVQDLAVFRFSNAIIEPLWNRALIDSVQITAAETVGVEKRAGYYESAGAVRDMVPNHLAELLSLIAMEPPVSFGAEHLRDKQVELLASTKRIKPDEVGKYAVRGQYGAGTLSGQQVPAYRREPDVPPESNIETYVAMRVEIDNWRWSGVPFYLRTGKRLTQALTEIVVTFRKPPAGLFPNGHLSDRAPNQMTFNLQPTQGIYLTIGTKAPGLDSTVSRGTLAFSFPSGPFGNHGKGYEKLLLDVMSGDKTLFQRAEFVEQGWQMVQPLLDAWQNSAAQDFPNYAAGSDGPQAAVDLLAADGHEWLPLQR